MNGLGVLAKDVMLGKCVLSLGGKNTVEKQPGENKMKKWQDKTDEEFKNDIMKMVEEGKLTKWDPWDHIKTLDEAKDYVEAIYEEIDREIVVILKSYMNFIKITDRTVKRFAKLPPQYKLMFDALVMKTQKKWGCLLGEIKKKQKAQKSAKKSA